MTDDTQAKLAEAQAQIAALREVLKILSSDELWRPRGHPQIDADTIPGRYQILSLIAPYLADTAAAAEAHDAKVWNEAIDEAALRVDWSWNASEQIAELKKEIKQ